MRSTEYLETTMRTFTTLFGSLLGLLAVSPSAGQSIVRASVDSAGGEANAASTAAALSGNGRFIAFVSDATGLVTGDTNRVSDVFVRDRHLGTTTRVSVDSAGVQGNARSHGPVSLSRIGRYVAFVSDASDLVSGDLNRASDVFVHDRDTGATTIVSVDSTGVQGNAASLGPSISHDGRFVAFSSAASDLVPGDQNRVSDVFVHDRQTGMTTRVSLDSAGAEANAPSSGAEISGDGSFVAFTSAASNLVVGDTNRVTDVFVHDLQTGVTTRVSVDSNGVEGNAASAAGSLSKNGRFVAFASVASDLVVGDINRVSDVFVHDRQTGTTVRVSVDAVGAEANAASDFPRISDDGRFVAFASVASDLVPGDTNRVADVFLVGRLSGEVLRVSVDASYQEGHARSGAPSVSGDGCFVAFESVASDLVTPDLNAVADVFVGDRARGGSVTAVGQGCQYDLPGIGPALSADRALLGQVTTFSLTGAPAAANLGVLLFDFVPPTPIPFGPHCFLHMDLFAGPPVLIDTFPVLAGAGQYQLLLPGAVPGLDCAEVALQVVLLTPALYLSNGLNMVFGR